ncbi:hypothetical protein [Peribacillus butanolivorans]|nr:hypothetical protein [Peribacillus butanolivorans]
MAVRLIDGPSSFESVQKGQAEESLYENESATMFYSNRSNERRIL